MTDPRDELAIRRMGDVAAAPQTERRELALQVQHRHRSVGDVAAASQVERREKFAPRGHRHYCRVGDIAAAPQVER